MKNAQAASRPRIQNRTIGSRSAQRPVSRLRAVPAQSVAPRRRRARKTIAAPLPNGLRVMGLLVCAGAAIALMLVVALGWQRNAYALAQQEVELRSALDQTGDERQQLLMDERRAINPRATAARGAEAGLNEFKLDERTGSQAPKAAATTNIIKVAKPQAATKPQTSAKPQASAKPLPKPIIATAAKAPKPSPAPTMTKATVRTPAPSLPASIAKAAGVKAALAR